MSAVIFEVCPAEGQKNEWRRPTAHRRARRAGRETRFSDYRLRVAHVLRDPGMFKRAEAPADSLAEHDATEGFRDS